MGRNPYLSLGSSPGCQVPALCLGWFARASCMVLVSQTDAGAILTVPDLLSALGVPDEVWSAFVHVAGDPGNDIRLVAAMPHWTIPQTVGAAMLPSGDRLTPIQAAQVGLVWRNARWVIHLRGGGDAGRFVDNDPWTMPGSAGPPDGSGHGDATGTSRTTVGGSSSGSKENLLKVWWIRQMTRRLGCLML